MQLYAWWLLLPLLCTQNPIQFQNKLWDQITQLALQTTGACRDRLQHAINNFISDPTLSTFLQYSGKGMSDLGMYTECLKRNDSKYILFSVSVQSTMKVANIGICSPKECDVSFYEQYKAQLVAFMNSVQTEIVMTEDMMQFNETKVANAEHSKFSSGNYIGVIFIILLLVFCIVATVIDRTYSKVKASEISKQVKFIRCFSISSNLSAILYSENRVDKNLDVLNGVRTLSCAWVVLGHCFMFMLYAPIINLSDFLKTLTDSFWFTLVTNATVSVDVFFTLSGFLATLGFTKTFIDPKKRKVSIVLMSYLRRYLRLLPIYASVFLFIYNVMPFLGDGPVYYQSSSLLDVNCNETWWANVLYVSNLIKNDKLCIAWSWYISNDMQFFLITPWIVWLYSISKIAGILLVIALMVASFIITAIITVHKGLSLSITAMFASTDMRGESYFTVLYFKPYARIPTYLIGIFIAWLYLAHKDKKFSYGIWNKINNAIKNRGFRYFSYIFGYAFLTFSLLIYSVFNQHYDLITQASDVAFILFDRPAFIIGLFMVIYPVMIGYGKPLLHFLGNDAFNAIAKLTYSIYMLHLLMYSYYMFNTLQAIEFSALFLVTRSGDVLMFGILIGIICTFMFDSPMLQIEKHFLFPEIPKIRGEMKNESPTVLIAKTAETDQQINKDVEIKPLTESNN